jgi:Flp pilus assembly protein TadG
MRAVRAARGRRWGRGQALVELAISAPFLLILLGGSAQLGTIAYGAVTVDTAAREGARVATENPHTSLDALSSSPYTCTANDANPICVAVRNASGMLDSSKFTITITSPAQVSRVPDDVVRVSVQSCSTSQATVTGTVSNLPSGATGATVQGSAGGSQSVVSTGTNGAYTLCLNPGSQVVTANSSIGGCDYGDSARLSVAAGVTYTQNFTLPSSCPTPPPLSTATPAPIATPGPTPFPTATPVPGASCPSETRVTDSEYVTVTVSYPVPVFVPGAGFLGDPGNSSRRTDTASVTMEIEPCTLTQGQ